jgi:flagellar basal-body rod protein FlgF
MNATGYVSLSRAAALERSMNMTAHNLANLNTAGFKAINPLLETVNEQGPEGGVSYVLDKGNYLDLRDGDFVPTGNPFDLAVTNDAWFTYALPDGGTGYSRDGRLVLDIDGQLKNASGFALLDEGGAPILLPGDLGESVIVGPDGTLTDVEGVDLGRIGVVNIEDAARLEPLGAGLYALPEGAADPDQAEAPALRQGYIEQSNVAAVLEMTRLIDIQRAYENSTKLMTEENDLTRSAIERLGRV